MYLNKLVDLEHFLTVAKALSVPADAVEGGSLEIDSPAHLNLGLMPEANRMPFSDRFLLQMVAGILRSADKLKVLGSVFQTEELKVKFMAVGNTDGLLDEFKDLSILASSLSSTPHSNEARGLVLSKLDS